MNKKYIVDLSVDEEEMLLSIVNKGKGPAYRIKHAYILLNSNINEVLPLFLLAESIKDINLADCKMVGV